MTEKNLLKKRDALIAVLVASGLPERSAKDRANNAAQAMLGFEDDYENIIHDVLRSARRPEFQAVPPDVVRSAVRAWELA